MMKGYNKSMSKNKTRTFGISWWIGLVLFAGMICLMLGDILHRDGVIGSKTDVLVMGTNAGFKPFEYIDNNQVVGFDVDLAREIAKSLGKDLKVEDMSFDGLLPALDSGQIDMVAALGVKIDGDRLGLGTNLFSGKKTLVEQYGGIENLNSELSKRSAYYENKIFTKSGN